MKKAVHIINADLVNNLANLVSRSTAPSMNPKQRYPSFDVEVMEHDLKGSAEKITNALNDLAERVAEDFNKMLFHKGLEDLAEAAKNANAFFQLYKPWTMSEGPDKQTVMFIIYETIRIVNILLQPIVPNYADRSLTRLGLEKNERRLEQTKLGGGPTIKLYGRPLGPDSHVMERIQYNPDGSPVDAHDGDDEPKLGRAKL